MNKNQWHAVSSVFAVFAILGVVLLSLGNFVVNIQNTMYRFLTWICFLGMFISLACGRLESEDKK